MRINEKFNKSSFSIFLNSFSGRIFRIFMGSIFIILGIIYLNHTIGLISLIWGIFPFSAGVFDICYISAVLGGPLSGSKIRHDYQKQ